MKISFRPHFALVWGLLCVSLITGSPAHAAKRQYALLAGSGEACTLALDFLNSEKKKLPPQFTLPAQVQTPPAAKLPEPAQGEHMQNFDVDNDGVPDQVFMQEGGGSYLLGTLMYVQHGKPGTALKANPGVADLTVYPCQFDPSVQKSAACPTFAQDADEAGIALKSGDGKPIFFRGRYIEMTPLRYQNKTWLLLLSASGDTRKYAALIEPEPGKKYRQTCLFKHK